jgi:hypothetical protein
MQVCARLTGCVLEQVVEYQDGLFPFQVIVITRIELLVKRASVLGLQQRNVNGLARNRLGGCRSVGLHRVVKCNGPAPLRAARRHRKVDAAHLDVTAAKWGLCGPPPAHHTRVDSAAVSLAAQRSSTQRTAGTLARQRANAVVRVYATPTDHRTRRTGVPWSAKLSTPSVSL